MSTPPPLLTYIQVMVPSWYVGCPFTAKLGQLPVSSSSLIAVQGQHSATQNS